MIEAQLSMHAKQNLNFQKSASNNHIKISEIVLTISLSIRQKNEIKHILSYKTNIAIEDSRVHSNLLTVYDHGSTVSECQGLFLNLGNTTIS